MSYDPDLSSIFSFISWRKNVIIMWHLNWDCRGGRVVAFYFHISRDTPRRRKTVETFTYLSDRIVLYSDVRMKFFDARTNCEFDSLYSFFRTSISPWMCLCMRSRRIVVLNERARVSFVSYVNRYHRCRWIFIDRIYFNEWFLVWPREKARVGVLIYRDSLYVAS